LTPTQTAEQMLNTFEKENIAKNIWPNTRRGTVHSLYKLCSLYIAEDIKIRRLGWAGHIIRMGEERIKKNRSLFFYTLKPVGRPRTRWADVVQKDALQLLGIRGWRRRAENMDEWRRLMREAKAPKGL